MKLSEVSVKRPVFATMMILALLVVGMFSYIDLPVELMPEVDFPFVVVQTVFPGASAESVETDVSKKIEDVVNQISGVRHIDARSREGLSTVVIEFRLEKDGTVAAQDVREKISTVRQDLPDDIEEPIVTQFDNAAMPIMSLAIAGKRPLKDITEIAKLDIKPRLEVVPGVGSVELIGGFEREIRVAVNPERMEYYGVTVDDVRMSVANANMEIPGGRIDESSREYLVRMKGRLDRVEDFNNVIVKNNEGTPVYLADLARVVDTVVEQRSLSRFDGETTIGLNILRQSRSNVVDMAARARVIINQLRDELPPDIDIKIVDDNSTFINDSIHEIQFNIEFGTLLAVIVIFLFLLDAKPTIITGIAIPISLIATFTFMKMLGFTVNIMTLLGLSLSVGILVDDAIVVIENIYRHIDEGKTPFQAALAGTQEIGLAVMATTFSIVVVFLPVAFMEGIVGRYFYQFGMSVAFAVLISLFVAFTMTPMLASRWFKSRNDDQNANSKKSMLGRIWASVLPVLKIWNRTFDALKPIYERLLGVSLRHRIIVMIIASAAFVAAIAMVGAGLLGVEFFPTSDEGKVMVSFETPPGTVLEDSAVRIAKLEAMVKEMPEVDATYLTIGQGNAAITSGRLLIKLIDAEKRSISAQSMNDSVRILASTIPGLKVSVGQVGEGGGEKPIELSIRGEDRDELARIAHELQEIAYTIPGATDVDNTLEEGKPEIQVQIDRELADDLALSLGMIPMTVRNLVEGDVVTRFKDGDEEYDVRVQLDEPYRESLEDISRIPIESDKTDANGSPLLIPLGRVAKLDKATSIGQFNRHDRQNEVRVNANALSTAFSGTVAGELQLKSANIQLPPGYSISTVGQQEMMAESFANILKALLLAVIFIYLLLASQYESFSDPFSIMLSLPLSLVGAILALAITGTSLSIMSLIGIVLLMGLVTKNAILLIDFVKQQREKGVARDEAILIAGPIRLRPILMTTFATVFGMLPLALGLGPGAEIRAPMARAAIGGMISSTLLTLVVVPVVYTIIEDFVGLFRRKKNVPGRLNTEEPLLDQ